MRKPPTDSTLHTATGSHRLRLHVADTFATRLRGLMLCAPLSSAPQATEALLLKRCASVHTAFMRYPIDVAYLDAQGRVVRCVPGLKPWRASAAGVGAGREGRARHTLELPEGAIARLAIAPGAHLTVGEAPAAGAAVLAPNTAIVVAAQASIPAAAGAAAQAEAQDRGADPAPLPVSPASLSARAARPAQRGATLVEFALVGPLITLLGLALVQYALLFNAKSVLNHAAFMAARAGSTAHARLGAVRQAYARALVPLYGGGRNSAELAAAYARAAADVAVHARVEVLNPTRESFDDWNNAALAAAYGARAIPNAGLAFKRASDVGARSGQNIQDANLLKLRLTHGYAPKVPLVGALYAKYLQQVDPKTDAFHTQLVGQGLIPVVSHVTLQMQSDPVEDVNASAPGMGNGGQPADPAPAPVTGTEPPRCAGAGCSVVEPQPAAPDGGGAGEPGSGAGSGTGGTGAPEMCAVEPSTTTSMPADVLFEFGQSTLTAAGRALLDQALADARTDPSIESVTLTGYTDQLGSASLNAALSLQRAQAVRAYLQAQGAGSVPIEVRGLGPSNPKVALADCPAGGAAQISCLAPNRRVDITVRRRAASEAAGAGAAPSAGAAPGAQGAPRG